MSDKKLYTKEDFDFVKEKITLLLEKCQTVAYGQPYEYENNHFKLLRELANYFVMTEENNNE